MILTDKLHYLPMLLSTPWRESYRRLLLVGLGSDKLKMVLVMRLITSVFFLSLKEMRILAVKKKI